ncbi:uncharacterized protein LOC120076160 [Benincasa hispida]|uniref:uncharacterized protein LOC120076160 n=1 Tax=Benincasa hispida TaxID=102211 RepID=UPI0018FFE518|nr:uncharacterized protein LOC120076160 [Benincasa hispida]
MIHELYNARAALSIAQKEGLLASFQVRPTLIEDILREQLKDSDFQKLAEEVDKELRTDYQLRADRMLLKEGKICIPKDLALKQAILEEAHSSAYAMHLGSTKMFGRKRKLSPRYIGPYEIIERVGPMAYRLDLPPELSRTHDVFHVAMLRKYVPGPTHVSPEQPVQLKENFSYKEKPMKILDRKEQVLRNKTIPLVKVLWRNHSTEEATWEAKEQIRNKYPQLFN